MKPGINRKGFIELLAGAAIALTVPFDFSCRRFFEAPSIFKKALGTYLSNLTDAAIVGREAHKALALSSAGSIASELFVKSGLKPDPSIKECQEKLSWMHLEDMKKGTTVRVSGWILSETEAKILSYVYLSGV